MDLEYLLGKSRVLTVASRRRLAKDLPYMGRSTIWSGALGTAFGDGRLCFHLCYDIVESSCPVVEEPLEAFERRMEAAAWRSRLVASYIDMVRMRDQKKELCNARFGSSPLAWAWRCSEVVRERIQYCHRSWTLTILMDWLLEWYRKSLRSIRPDKNDIWREP